MAEKKNGKNGKKNEFEIWAQYSESISQLIADEAQRLKRLSAAMHSGESEYTLGDFLLDQTRNTTKLIEKYIEASDKAAGRPKRKT